MALFVLASKDGWVEIMYNGIDAVGVDMQVRVKKIVSITFYLLTSNEKLLLVYSIVRNGFL